MTAGPVPVSGGTVIPASPSSSDFPIDWPNPADERLSWELDDMHMPFPLAPLARDYVEILASGFNPVYVEWGLNLRIYARIFHGYCYFTLDAGVPEADEDAEMARRTEACRAFAPVNVAYWTDEALPRLEAIERQMREIDVDGLPGPDLAVAWDAAWATGAEAWAIHFKAIRGAYQSTEDLADLYDKAVEGAPAGEALELIQGRNTTLHAVEAGVETLTDLLADLPAVRARVAASPAPSLEELEALPRGEVFAREMRRFLDEHGHLGQPFDDLGLPSWAEEPSILLAEIGQRLAHPPERSAHRVTRLQRHGDALADRVRERLAADAAGLARFEDQLALARSVGPLTEIHNYWIDRLIQARLRALSFRVGRRLVRDGAVDSDEDVLYLHRDEIAATLREPADRRSLVAERRAEHTRQGTLTPPRIIGAPLRLGESIGRFDSPAKEHESSDELHGVGASAGMARGPARVALGPEDFGRIQPGDVIVCPSSNPSWVPVFAIAGGLVTNTGGVLAHAAVVAREFGLPAVVGVTGATTLIADGRTVEIDGTAGIVRLL